MWWQKLIAAIIGILVILWFMRSYFFQQARRIPAISPEEMDDLLANGAVLVDVRRKEEYQAGHIPGAVHMRAEEAEKNFSRRFPDKNGKYVFYCSSGLRSDIVMDLLKKQGYTNLYSFKKMKRYKGELARG
ncbi:MAG: rhodanese-like domain-containing protein [Peptoniphilaceae bacterium]|jgi:rhodanese-related sulfurtransferase|nr:rhodanese-like domain-containing protein [Bacillota bacterium]